LHCAAKEFHAEVVELLLKRGARVGQQTVQTKVGAKMKVEKDIRVALELFGDGGVFIMST
tara:strand:- start:1518 stop:1697 length:180 start_codon:yes stop_codon:yes gene_type:complete